MRTRLINSLQNQWSRSGTITMAQVALFAGKYQDRVKKKGNVIYVEWTSYAVRGSFFYRTYRCVGKCVRFTKKGTFKVYAFFFKTAIILNFNMHSPNICVCYSLNGGV